MFETGSDSGDVDPFVQHGGDLVWRQHIQRNVVGTRLTVSDLAPVVVTPAPDVTIPSHRTRVVATGSDFSDVDLTAVRLPKLNLHRRRQPRRMPDAVSDLAPVVGAPAPDVTIPSHRTRVLVTGSDFGDVNLAAVRLQNLDLHRRQHRANATRMRLVVHVSAPAPDVTISSHRTRVVGAGSDFSDVDLAAVRLPNLDLHRRQHFLVIAVVVVTDLSGPVGAPA